MESRSTLPAQHLHEAIQSQDIDYALLLWETLLRHPVASHASTEKNGKTLLAAALEAKMMPLAETIFRRTKHDPLITHAYDDAGRSLLFPALLSYHQWITHDLMEVYDDEYECYLWKIRDNSGQLPSHALAQTGNFAIARKFFDKIATFSAKDKDFCLNATDDLGNTPLHYAIQKQLPGMITFLIALGANVHAPNNENKTPAHFLKQMDFFPALGLTRLLKPEEQTHLIRACSSLPYFQSPKFIALFKKFNLLLAPTLQSYIRFSLIHVAGLRQSALNCRPDIKHELETLKNSLALKEILTNAFSISDIPTLTERDKDRVKINELLTLINNIQEAIHVVKKNNKQKHFFHLSVFLLPWLSLILGTIVYLSQAMSRPANAFSHKTIGIDIGFWSTLVVSYIFILFFSDHYYFTRLCTNPRIKSNQSRDKLISILNHYVLPKLKYDLKNRGCENLIRQFENILENLKIDFTASYVQANLDKLHMILTKIQLKINRSQQSLSQLFFNNNIIELPEEEDFQDNLEFALQID